MPLSEQLIKLKELYDVTETSGFAETHMSNVRFFWSNESVPCSALPHTKGIIIIGQGQKIGRLNGRTFHYDANNYLISSVPTAYECETCATPNKPVLGILVDIDTARLSQIIDKVKEHLPHKNYKTTDIFCGIEPVQMDANMRNATSKLVECLHSKLDCEVLGQSLVDEIIYRALLGGHGNALFALTQQNTHYARIAQVLNYIHENYARTLSVNELAAKAAMSQSAFHRGFKDVTGDSPIQYIKKVRLNKARSLIISTDKRVSVAAKEVGYESTSQFSREFKRYFKIAPSEAQLGAYAALY